MTHRALTDLAHARRDQPAPGATWREVADVLRPQGVAPRAVIFTLKNMARAGAVLPVGAVRVAGSSRALMAYAPAPQHDAARTVDDGAVYLDLVARAWVARPMREPDG